MFFTKMLAKILVKIIKIFFKKKLFDLTIEIYKKLILEEQKLKFEESTVERVKLKNERAEEEKETGRREKFDYEQAKEFLNFLKENIGMKLFNKIFKYKAPDEMLQVLQNSKGKNENISILNPIMDKFNYFAKKIKEMPNNTNKEQVKILSILNQIFSFNDHIQWGQGLKILTTNQMLSRLPICLAQLKAGNKSEKLKNQATIALSAQIKKTCKKYL